MIIQKCADDVRELGRPQRELGGLHTEREGVRERGRPERASEGAGRASVAAGSLSYTSIVTCGSATIQLDDSN